MLQISERYIVDSLVSQFWKRGYLTLSRRFGTYLPEPERVGEFNVDVIARQRNKYAIGITLTESDLNSTSLREKLIYLATRHTKFSNQPVTLFVAVSEFHIKRVKNLLAQLNDEVKRNIKLLSIVDQTITKTTKSGRKTKVLFS